MNNRFKYAKCREGKVRSPITGECMGLDVLKKQDESRNYNFLVDKYGVWNLDRNQKFLPEWIFKGKRNTPDGLGYTRFVFSECFKNGISLQKKNSKGMPLWDKTGNPKFKTYSTLRKECVEKYTSTDKPTTEDKLLLSNITPVPSEKGDSPLEWFVPIEDEVQIEDLTWNQQISKDTWQNLYDILTKILSQEPYSTDNLSSFEKMLLDITKIWLQSKYKNEFLDNLEIIYDETILPNSQNKLLVVWADILTLYWNSKNDNIQQINKLINKYYGGDPLPLLFVKKKLCPLKKSIR